jgi:imidazolonepropionase-like amidohydrolase
MELPLPRGRRELGPRGDYGAELTFYVKQLGIPALDVIRWATQNGADAMDRGEELGRVAVGRRADLLVVDGDPLQDITYLENPDNVLAVFQDGRVVKDRLAQTSSPFDA